LFKTIHETIQEHGIHEDDIWNFDETGFAMGLYTPPKAITAVECSERPCIVTQGNREWVIIIECIGSSGIFTPPVNTRLLGIKNLNFLKLRRRQGGVLY
jgi:hypothetical protein